MKKIKPVIYQLMPRLFGNTCGSCVPSGTIEQNGCGKFNDITPKVLDSIKSLGVTHVWYTGVIEHSQQTDYSAYGIRKDNPYVVKGKAGSPYAIKDYYDVDPDLAIDVARRMDEFDALLARTHAAGMKVIIDFVPNHVSRQYHSDAKPAGVADFGDNDDNTVFFSPTNNFYYIPHQLFAPSIPLGDDGDAYVEFPAKASGNDCFTAFPSVNDWYETVKLNYGRDYGDWSQHFDPRPPTWDMMLDILRYWVAKGVDGFRCDMAHMVPVEFWQWAIAEIKREWPDVVFIAEIYDVALYRDFIYRGGFDYLYDKVNLYDTLRAIECGNTSAARITNCWQTVDGIGEHMLNFLENHDEQRFASVQYAGDANSVLPSLVVSTFIADGPMMIYMGQELGERGADAEGFSGADGRTTIFDYWSVPTLRRWLSGDGSALTADEWRLRSLYSTVLNLANTEPSLRQGAFFDLMYVNYDNPTFNPHRVYAFLRTYGDEVTLVAVNFGSHKADVRVNIPAHAFDVLEMPVGSFSSTELLTGMKSRVLLSPDNPFPISIEGHGAVVWKIKLGAKDKNVE